MRDNNTLIVEYAGKIAKSANAWVVVRGAVLKFISRIQNGEPTVIPTSELIEMKIGKPKRIKRITSNFSVNVPYPSSYTLETEEKQVVIENSSYGQELTFEPLSNVEDEQRNYLSNLLIIEKKPESSIEVTGIRDEWEIGDKIKAVDSRLGISATVTIASIRFNFATESTWVSGASDLDQVYQT